LLAASTIFLRSHPSITNLQTLRGGRTRGDDPNRRLRSFTSHGPTSAGCRPIQHRTSVVHGVSKADDQQIGFRQRSSSASTIGVFALFQAGLGPRHLGFGHAEAHHRQSTALNHLFDPTLRSEAVQTHSPTYLPTPRRHGLQSVRPPKAFTSPIKKTPQQDRRNEENASRTNGNLVP
jgi:hypothetical protein